MADGTLVTTEEVEEEVITTEEAEEEEAIFIVGKIEAVTAVGSVEEATTDSLEEIAISMTTTIITSKEAAVTTAGVKEEEEEVDLGEIDDLVETIGSMIFSMMVMTIHSAENKDTPHPLGRMIAIYLKTLGHSSRSDSLEGGQVEREGRLRGMTMMTFGDEL